MIKPLDDLKENFIDKNKIMLKLVVYAVICYSIIG